MAFAALALALASHASARTEKLLHDFAPLPFGANPSAPLIQDSAGNLYGETTTGGVHGYGVVFELTRNSNGGWSHKVIHAFSGSPDGSSPQGRLVLDSAGNLYGTTYRGGNTIAARRIGYRPRPGTSRLKRFCTLFVEIPQTRLFPQPASRLTMPAIFMGPPAADRING